MDVGLAEHQRCNLHCRSGYHITSCTPTHIICSCGYAADRSYRSYFPLSPGQTGWLRITSQAHSSRPGSSALLGTHRPTHIPRCLIMYLLPGADALRLWASNKLFRHLVALPESENAQQCHGLCCHKLQAIIPLGQAMTFAYSGQWKESHRWQQAVLYAAETQPTHEEINLRLRLSLALKLERRQQRLESLPPVIRSKTGTICTCSPLTTSSTPACDITAGEVSFVMRHATVNDWECFRAHHLRRLSRRA